MADLGRPARIARFFVDSNLTPLFIAAAVVLGIYGLLVVPRQEEPVVEVPTAMIFIGYPGAAPDEVDARVARPVQGALRRIEIVTAITSAAAADGVLFTAEFVGGTPDDRAYARVQEELAALRDVLPERALPPLVTLIGREDIPALTMAFWSEWQDPLSLRRMVVELVTELDVLEGVRHVQVYGGHRRELRVELDLPRMAAHGIAPDQVVDAIRAANVELPADRVEGPGGSFRVDAGIRIRGAHELGELVVGEGGAGPLLLRDVARTLDAPTEASAYLFHGNQRDGRMADRPAVVLSVQNLPGTHASDVSQRVMDRIEELRGVILTDDVHTEVVFDRGAEADRHVRNVLEHLLLATVIVIGIITLGLGWRAGLITVVVIPVSLAVVPAAYHLLGFSLNPISIAAMILAIGILADDAVIVVENIARYFEQGTNEPARAAIEATDEVGDPVVLANAIVVAALLPTAFLTGEMGQFLRALPIGAATAIMFSLLVAFVVAPYLTIRLYPTGGGGKDAGHGNGRDRSHASGGNSDDAQGDVSGPSREQGDDAGVRDRAPEGVHSFYKRVLGPFLDSPRRRWLLYAGLLVALAGSLALLAVRAVRIELTPRIDIPAFLITLELPDTAMVETTAAAAADLAAYLRTVPEVRSYQVYAGMDGPDLFPGMLELVAVGADAAPNRAQIHVQLIPEEERVRHSYQISRQLRDPLSRIAAPYQARVAAQELRAGPGALAGIVAEIYGPSYDGQLEVARQVERVFRQVPGLGDIDHFPGTGEPRVRLAVEPWLASIRGVAHAQVARAVRVATAGESAGLALFPDEREPVPIRVTVPRERITSVHDLRGLSIPDPEGRPVPVADITTLVRDTLPPDIHRRDLRSVAYVTGEIVEEGVQPLYVQLDMHGRLDRLATPDGQTLNVHWLSRPEQADRYSLFWAGEWEMTFTAYRDLGLAFLVVLALIYVIMIGWFRSFMIPLIIMLPIPLTLVGIIPAHLLYGIPLSGQAVMGFIALAGVAELDSLLLVDFIKERRKRGMDLREAVTRAGAIRTRPIVLTRLTFIFGAGTLILEPQLEGMGLAMASGAVMSTLITLLLVPVLYFHLYEGREEPAAEEPAS